jgi:hypothetical protein
MRCGGYVRYFICNGWYMGINVCTLISSEIWMNGFGLCAYLRLVFPGLMFLTTIIRQLTLEIRKGRGLIHCVIFRQDKGGLPGTHFKSLAGTGYGG